MALESAGLAIGAVALLSLVKDCVDLFDYISVSRALERDYDVLNAKLDIEKTHFLSWIERTNVLTDNYDDRLDHPQLCSAVNQALTCIYRLLSESEPLKSRYGLVEDADQKKNDTAQPILSRPRMGRVIEGFQALDVSALQRRRDLSTRVRMRWAAVDRTKFNTLIDDLSYFVSQLDKIVPPNPELVVKMARDDLQPLSSGTLRLLLDAAHGERTTLSSEAERLLQLKCEEKILRLLWFRVMDDRRDSVKPPHSQTLAWALHDSQHHRQWDSIPDWLASKSLHRIYWLSGKAGSGKSTLMKYMCTHPLVRTYSEKWAGDHNLLVDSFFFWNLGTPEQKTYSGLWRALLYKILKSEPGLIPILLPNIWQEAYCLGNQQLEMPTDAEIDFAFGRLVETVDHKSFYCFFIDGLDEYSGNYDDAITFFNQLANSQNFKFVISSRPIGACDRAYGSGPKLSLQDLTKHDIELYVEERVSKHPYARTITETDPIRAEKMLSDLVKKSSGVFLWVVLACRSVLEGFNNFDDLGDLERRVDELPPELGSLFQHMLDHIEPRYREQAALLLWLAYESYSRQYAHPLSTVGLAIIDEYVVTGAYKSNYIINAPSPNSARCFRLRERLRSRCRGLLEVAEYDNNAPWDEEKDKQDDLCFCVPKKTDYNGVYQHDPLLDSTVHFVHRSVYEFLQMPQVRHLKYLELPRVTCLRPGLLLAQMSLELHRFSIENCYAKRRVEYIHSRDSHFQQGDHYIRETLQCLDRVGVLVDHQRAIAVLRALDETVTRHGPRVTESAMRRLVDERKFLQDLPKQIPALMLIYAIEMALLTVVQIIEKSDQGSWKRANTLLNDPSFLIINICAWANTLNEIQHYPCDEWLVMTRYLLKSGCKTHDPRYDWTAWRYWTVEMKLRRRSIRNSFEVHDTTRCFIEANAEEVQLRLLYETDEDMESFSQWVQDELMDPSSTKVTPESSKAIFQLIEESYTAPT
ncbi:prion-inhibition and propagation-domain-containing protein [Xylariaceae sp. FL1019]|nr:prion-inhibition and propagation-domain-containing protein [Xylariaceae sp. FL1019]